MTTYNLSAVSGNATDLLQLTQNTNSILFDGWLGIGILMTIFFIMLINFYRGDRSFERALTAALFLIWPFALLLRGMSLLSDIIVTGTLILSAVAIASALRES